VPVPNADSSRANVMGVSLGNTPRVSSRNTESIFNNPNHIKAYIFIMELIHT